MEIKEIPAIVVNNNYDDIITQGTLVKIKLQNGEEKRCVFVGVYKDEITFDNGNVEESFIYKINEIESIQSI